MDHPCEGIETACGCRVGLRVEIEAGEAAVASAITAGGVEAFQPYPDTTRVTVAADRDEAPKPNGKPGRGGASRRRASSPFATMRH